MTSSSASAAPALARRSRSLAVGGVFALQGAGYAVVVTALPSFQSRVGLDATAVSLILLGVCVTAAAGSVLADALAVRRNSMQAVAVGFAVQAVSLTVMAVSSAPAVFIAGALAYGLGLGVIDAASNMQGVLVQRGSALPLLGRFYAAYTSGAILGAVAMSLALASGMGAIAALVTVAVLQLLLIVVATRRLDPERAARAAHDAAASPKPLPARAIVVTGLVVLAAFTIDSAVSSWGAVHLAGLGAAAALVPVGYAVYQASVLVVRLGADVLVRQIGPRALMTAAVVVGALGGLLIAFVGGPVAAIGGFALSGLAVGALVPLAFTRAGTIEPSRSDEVIARVNLFNYAGAVIGAVGVGLAIDTVGSSIAFLLPVVLLAAAVPALLSARHSWAPGA